MPSNIIKLYFSSHQLIFLFLWFLCLFFVPSINLPFLPFFRRHVAPTSKGQYRRTPRKNHRDFLAGKLQWLLSGVVVPMRHQTGCDQDSIPSMIHKNIKRWTWCTLQFSDRWQVMIHRSIFFETTTLFQIGHNCSYCPKARIDCPQMGEPSWEAESRWSNPWISRQLLSSHCFLTIGEEKRVCQWIVDRQHKKQYQNSVEVREFASSLRKERTKLRYRVFSARTYLRVTTFPLACSASIKRMAAFSSSEWRASDRYGAPGIDVPSEWIPRTWDS
jgi:hypothetical protein